jgi:hypothetical protein
MNIGSLNGRDGKGVFVKGHKPSPETLAKIRATKKEHPHSHPCWTKGLTKETDERIARMAVAKTGKNTGPRPYRKGIRVAIATEFKKGLVPKGGLETRFKTGSDHPLWNGGVTSEHDKIRRGRQYRQWRDAVYRRDHFHCQTCQKHCEQMDIVAHHKNGFAAYKHLRFVVDNGITLCRRCHLSLHQEEDRKLCASGT